MTKTKSWKKRNRKTNHEKTVKCLGRMQKDIEEMKTMYPKFFDEYLELKEHNEKRYILQLIHIREDLVDSIWFMEKKGFTDEQGKKYLRMCCNTVTDMLEDHGVIIWKSEEGEKFDSNTHTIIKKVLVDDAEFHGIIAKVVKPGYKWRDLVVKKMEVEVYSCR